jgi:hypothetical protein
MSRTLVAVLLLFCASARAEYTDSCSMFALTLSGSADNYNSKLRSFKSACDSYIGYSKDDESACGEYGIPTFCAQASAARFAGFPR